MGQIEVDGLRIAFERRGEGPPLILLHGGLSDSREWRKQLDDFSDDFTVVAWDAPGCGRSSDPPETFRLPDYADCLAAFIELLGLERPHVLGLSFGAGLALELYRRHPFIPRTLVLASAYAGWAGSLPPDVVEQRLQRALKEAELPPETLVRGYLEDLLSESVPEALAEELAAIMADVRAAGMRMMAHAFAEADLRDILPSIAIPTLLLYGDHDRRVPRQVAENLHAGIPRSKLVVIPGVGHQSNMEAPQRFNDEVRSFLGSVQA